jgi:hypothetical protein
MGDAQTSSMVYIVLGSLAAFFIVDLKSAYFEVTSSKRGIRTINGRKQVLLPDEIIATGSVTWRMRLSPSIRAAHPRAWHWLDRS